MRPTTRPPARSRTCRLDVALDLGIFREDAEKKIAWKHVYGALTGGARVRTHNQNMTVAAIQMAERKSSPHLS